MLYTRCIYTFKVCGWVYSVLLACVTDCSQCNI